MTAQIGGQHWVDGLNEAQLRARTDWTWPLLADLWQRHSTAALKARRRMPAPVRALPLLPIGTGLGVHIGWQPISYLFDMGFTRDVWMHRIDIARAAGIQAELTAEHDGRIIAGIVAEWSRRHGQPYTLILTGPAGGTFHTGDGEPQTVDAVEFAPDPLRSLRWSGNPPPQASALTPAPEPSAVGRIMSVVPARLQSTGVTAWRDIFPRHPGLCLMTRDGPSLHDDPGQMPDEGGNSAGYQRPGRKARCAGLTDR